MSKARVEFECIEIAGRPLDWSIEMKTEMKQVIGALVLFAAIMAITAAKDDLAKGLRRGGWFSPVSHRL
jgi:hypothetical protein